MRVSIPRSSAECISNFKINLSFKDHSTCGPARTQVSRYPTTVGIFSLENTRLTTIDRAKIMTISLRIPSSTQLSRFPVQ